MTDGKKPFCKKNDKLTYKNIKKAATGQGNDYTTGCLLDYTYFKNIKKLLP